MNINYEYYKIFYYVGKYKNITRAAVALKSNQPNVTRVIKLLEAELGCQLVIRGNKGISLTEDGKRLYERTEAAFFQLQAAEEELSRSHSGTEGTIILGTTETALHLMLFDKIGEFHKKYPKVRFKIQNYSTKTAIKELETGAIDMCVIATPFEVSKEIKCEKIMSFNEILLGGEDFKFLTGKRQTLRDLTDYPFISLARGTATYEMISSFFIRQGAVMNPDIEVATADCVLPMIRNNLGIGFVPEAQAASELKKGNVFRIQLETELDLRELCILYDKKKGQRQSEKLFCEFMK